MDRLQEHAVAIQAAASAASAVLAFIVAAASAIAGNSWWQKYKVRKKRACRVSERIAKVPEIDDELNRIALEFGCDRGLLLVAENGSSLFPAYGTVVYEVVLKPGIRAIRSLWQRVSLDRSYKAVIGAAVNTAKDFVEIKTEEMPEGLLKDTYLIDEIKRTIVVPLKRSHCDDWCVYLSLNCQNDGQVSPLQAAAVRLGASRLRELMYKFLPE